MRAAAWCVLSRSFSVIRISESNGSHLTSVAYCGARRARRHRAAAVASIACAIAAAHATAHATAIAITTTVTAP